MKQPFIEASKGAWWTFGAAAVIATLVSSFYIGIEGAKRQAEEALSVANDQNAKLRNRVSALERQGQGKDADIHQLMQKYQAAAATSPSQISVQERELQNQIESLKTALAERERRLLDVSFDLTQLKSGAREQSQKAHEATQAEQAKSGELSQHVSPEVDASVFAQPSFENKQFRATPTGVRMADDRKSVRVTTEIRNLTSAVLYLADDAYGREIASTEYGDEFDKVTISGIKRIGSLRSDTYEKNKNYTAIPPESIIRIIWSAQLKKGEPPVQGKSLTIRSEFFWLSESSPKRIPFQISEIRL